MSDVHSASRLEALRRTGLLDSPSEETFDRLTRLASAFLKAPVALLSLVDKDRQFFKSAIGLPEPEQSTRCTSLEYSFCRYAVESGQPLIVADAREHPLVRSNPAISELGVIAYAGIPLVTDDHHALGTLCVFDTVPRVWSEQEVSVLRDLAASAITEITLRRELVERERAERERATLRHQLEVERERIGTLFEQAPAFIAWVRGPRHVFEGANRAYYQLVGHRELIGKTVAEALPEVVELGLVAALDRVLETGEPFVADGVRLLLQRTPGGPAEERFANFVYQPLVEADGTRSGIFCHGVDVTTHLHAVTALRESETHHRQVLDSLPVIVYRAEAEEPYVTSYVNAAVTLLGFTREEWLSRPDMWTSRVHPADRARVQRTVLDCRARAEPTDDQYRMIAKDGSVHWIHDRGDLLPDERGERCVWQGILLDITAQRDAEEALRATEARTRMLIETAQEGVWVANEAGVTTYANGRMCDMLGCAPEDVLGRSFLDFVAPASAAEAPILFARRRRGIAEMHELVLRRSDGSDVVTLMSGSPITTSDGVFAGALAMVTDITAHRVAEQALRESEARYRQVVANAPGMVYQCVYEPDGTSRFSFVSEGARALFGVEPEEITRDPGVLLRLIHPDEIEHFLSQSRAAAMAATGLCWEGRAVLASGEERFIQVSARDTRAADGVVLSDGMMVDITDRRRAAQRLEESELRFRLAARATRDVLYDWDVVADTHYWGESPEGPFGYGSATDEGALTWWSRKLHPDDLGRVRASLDAVLASSSESWSEEYSLQRRDGTYADVLDRGYVLRDDQMRPVRMVGSITDLTERQQLEEQFRQSQKMEAVGRLAGGVAHDFNNLLTVIKASAGFLLDELDTADPRREDARHVADAADRAAGLTRQLLAFSRKQVLEPTVLDVNRVVENLRPMLARLIGEDVIVEARLRESLGGVMADVGQLEQVLINLAVNARDAMPDGGTLTIETSEVSLDEQSAVSFARHRRGPVLPGNYVLLAVSDTGIGMSPEVRDRVFEPFYTTKEPGKGTGLGLSTVYGIIKQSGGHVWAYSEPGEGTVFKLYLPRLEAAASVSLRVTDGVPARGSETVLLVEDEDALRGLARRILERQGYRVLESRNGGDALAWVTAHEDPIDLILTDVVMPGLSGRGLVERLTAVRPGAAVIYMSGYTDDHVLRRGMLESGAMFIQKPFNASELLKLVRDALSRRAGREPAGASERR